MNHAITKFSKRVPHKLHEVEHRLEVLRTASDALVASVDRAEKAMLSASLARGEAWVVRGFGTAHAGMGGTR